MSKKTVEGQNAEQKTRSKKPLVALLLAAILGLGAYGGAKYYDKQTNEASVESEAPKEKVAISVSAKTVSVNGQEQKLADGQSWKKWLEEYFAKKDLSKTEVTVDYEYGDYDLVTEIKAALSELKINVTETKGGK